MKHTTIPHALARNVLLGAMLAGLATPGHTMDLLQAYQAAQKEDSTLRAAHALREAERERVPQARAQLLPNVSANLSNTKNQLTSESPNFLGQTQTTQTDYPSSSKTLTLRQPIYRSALGAQWRQAQAQVTSAEAIFAQEEQDLAARVGGAYFEALLALDQLTLIESQKQAYTTQLDAAKKAFAAGSGIRTDIDEAQARLDMNQAQALEAQQQVAYTRQSLQTLINQPVEQLSALDVAKFKPAAPAPALLADWVARAELHNPQLQSLKAQVDVAQEEVAKARAGHLPTLDAVAQWSDSKSESVTNTRSRYTNKTIGLQLSVPLFAGGYVNSQVRQTQANLLRAQEALEYGRRDLGLRVYKEFRGVTEGVLKVAALEQALRSAEQMLNSSRKSFEAGSRTLVDVMNAQQQRVLVLRDLAQARYVYLISHLRLLALAGAADEAAVAGVNQVLHSATAQASAAMPTRAP